METREYALSRAPNARKLATVVWGIGWLLPAIILFNAQGACSVLNREGPRVTCSDLQAGAISACEKGIIASCKDGEHVTYQVCTDSVDSTAAEDLCDASWQIKGAYSCSKPNSGSAGAGGRGQCLPIQGSPCDSCLLATCHDAYGQCLSDSTCASRCTGSAAVPLAKCLQTSSCLAGAQPSCTTTSEGYLR